MQASPVTEAPSVTGIPVENPATGETIATVPELGAEEVIRDGRRGARGAARRGPRSGSRAGPRSCWPRATGWSQNAERVVTTIVRRDRPTGRRDAVRRARLRALGARVLGRRWRRTTSADEEIESASPFLRGRRLVVRYAPLGRRRRDRALELPAQQLVRRLHPGARGGQRRRAEALRGHPAHLAADGRDARASAGCRRASSRSRRAVARPARRWSTRSTW